MAVSEPGTLSAVVRSPETSRRCRIVFRGESELLASVFDDLTSEFRDGNTVLTGELPDHARLLRIISRAQSLGFELVSLHSADRVRDDDE